MEPSKPKRGHRLLVVLLILSLAVYAAALVSESHQQSGSTLLSDAIAKINVGLTVTATHADGQVFATRSLPHDLILDRFNRMIMDYFRVGTGLPSLCGTGCSNGGNDIGKTANCNLGSFSYTATCGVHLSIGTSATAPARTDQSLTAAYTPTGGFAWFPDTAQNVTPQITAAPSVCNHGTTDTITGISGSQTITSSVTIQEAGLGISESGGSTPTLMFHDTFTGIAVVNGDTVTVTYELDLSNSGFNDNMCYFLAGLLTGNIAATGHVQETFTQTGGGTANFYIYCSTNNFPGIQTTGCATTSPIGKLAIGTGSSAFTTSSLNLGSSLSTQAISGGGYSSPTSYYTTTFTIAGTHTISEIGVFLTLSSNSYMFFALTFTGITQTDGVPFGITMRMAD